MTILILTEPFDPHARRIVQGLRERDLHCVTFNPAEFPSRAEISVSLSCSGQVRCSLGAGDAILLLNNLKAVWYRRPALPVPHREVSDKLCHRFVVDECNFLLHDVWNSLDCLWFPAPPLVMQKAALKASQLKLASALGFDIPPTLFTNSPAEFIEFYNRYNGEVVSKLAGPSFTHIVGKNFVRYTDVVAKREVGYAQTVRYAPVLFQSYVPKRLEVRATVVGRQVFTVEIHSQETNRTRHDWRRYDHYRTSYLTHELPQDVSQRCVRLVEELGLLYGAIDIVLTPDGRYVFLEINPNGQYLWIEEATQLPISHAICDLLACAS